MKIKIVLIAMLMLAGSLFVQRCGGGTSGINNLEVGPDGYWIPKKLLFDAAEIDSIYAICKERGHVWANSPYLGMIPNEFGFEPIIEDLPDKSIMIQRHTEQRRRCRRCGLIDFYTPEPDTTIIWERKCLHPHIYFNVR